jgi:hypothetical protein
MGLILPLSEIGHASVFHLRVKFQLTQFMYQYTDQILTNYPWDIWYQISFFIFFHEFTPMISRPSNPY